MSEENKVALFEERHLAAFKQLSELKREQERLAEIEKSIKEELEEAMNKYDIVSIKNDWITISRVASSETVTIDLKKFKENEPKLYDELLKDYPKVTTKKASIRFLVK